jgi:hypothetical protein
MTGICPSSLEKSHGYRDPPPRAIARKGDFGDRPIIPAKAGIRTDLVQDTDVDWIPAFAGMTGKAGG